MNAAAVFLCGVLTSTSTELSGCVVDAQGQGIAGAIVVVSTARPRVGPATTCPSCYPDCRKRTLTDAEGRFSIKGLSSKLLFSLASGGPGYQGLVSPLFDPADDPSIELKLESLPSSPEVTVAEGNVVDQYGNPIAGAEVRSRTIYRANGSAGGSDKSVTPLTLTNSDGRFQMTIGQHIRRLDLRVRAAGYAPAEAKWSRARDTAETGEILEIELGHGASIGGRLLLSGSPLSAVQLGIVQQDRTMGNIVTPAEVSSDENGYFQFDQLPPDMDYTIYTHTGQGAKGVLPVNLVRAPGHGQRAVLGDIATQSPQRLTVTVQTEDGTPLPEKSYVYVGRREAWWGSSLNLALQPSAQVNLRDVGREVFQISVRVPGWKVVKTRPLLNIDINGRYAIGIQDNTEVQFIVRKQGRPEPPKKVQ